MTPETESIGSDGETYDINTRAQRALTEAGAEIVGSPKRKLEDLDMLIVRVPRLNRAQESAAVSKLYKAFRKAYRKWQGLTVVLPHNWGLEQMPAAKVETLYEQLMQRFDPDLYRMRMAKKAALAAEARQDEARTHGETAHAVADRLEAIKAQGPA